MKKRNPILGKPLENRQQVPVNEVLVFAAVVMQCQYMAADRNPQRTG